MNTTTRAYDARVIKFAKVIYAMHASGHLRDPDLRPVVGALVRESMETKHYHCTTAYRTRKAQDLIASQAAKSKAQYHRNCKEQKLRHEHMVPTKVRIDMLFSIPELSEERIAHSLYTFGLRATIHTDEDQRLNDAGLKSTMPASFWTPGDPDYMNPLARYVAAGLHQDLAARSGAGHAGSATHRANSNRHRMSSQSNKAVQ